MSILACIIIIFRGLNDNSIAAVMSVEQRGTSYEDVVMKKTKQKDKSATYEVPPLEDTTESVRLKIQQGTVDSHGYEFVDLRKSPEVLPHKADSRYHVLDVSVQNEATEEQRGEENDAEDPTQLMYMNVSPPAMVSQSM